MYGGGLGMYPGALGLGMGGMLGGYGGLGIMGGMGMMGGLGMMGGKLVVWDRSVVAHKYYLSGGMGMIPGSE